MFRKLPVLIAASQFNDALQATFYPNAFPDCSEANSSTLALPNFDSLVPDPATPPRCQDALNYQVGRLHYCSSSLRLRAVLKTTSSSLGAHAGV